MKILVLTKRQYMGKDLLDDRFGRFRELPLELARLGHQVRGVCLSYRRRAEEQVVDGADDGVGQVQWRSVNLFRGLSPGLLRYLRQCREIIAGFQPDIIWAGSDAFHAIFGHRLAQAARCKLVVDLYDNFEAFTATKIPGVLTRFRRAVRSADGVTCFSQRLADYVATTYPLTHPHAVILNGVRQDLFYPRDRGECRRQLNLPDDAKIIGTAGALDGSRGIEALFDAYATLAAEEPQLHLALAGPRPAKQCIPSGPRIHDFHELAHEKVPQLINALDLAVICYRQSAQGEYSFPQKAYEIIASGVPLVAAAVGSMNELLRDHPDCLYDPADANDLARAIRRQLTRKVVVPIAAPSWRDSAAELARLFIALSAAEANSNSAAQSSAAS